MRAAAIKKFVKIPSHQVEIHKAKGKGKDIYDHAV